MSYYALNYSMQKKYEELLKLFKESLIVEEIAMLLYWDKDVTMPSGGLKQRAEQMAFIAELEHIKKINPRKGELLQQILEHPDYENLSDLEKRNVYLSSRWSDLCINHTNWINQI